MVPGESIAETTSSHESSCLSTFAVIILVVIVSYVTKPDHVCTRVNATPAVVDGGISNAFARATEKAALGTRVLSTDPWLVVVDDFCTEQEADALVQTVTQQNSFVDSEINNDGGAFIRTSSSLWCDTPECYDAPLVQRLMMRMSDLTATPVANAEVLQLLRYTPGQQYRSHHDFIGAADASAAGGRVYSFVLFLSTPEEGGELLFTDINVSVPARKGAAVLWPSLMDEDLRLPELHTHHASRPVVRGTKLAAVTWIRQHDYRTLALERRCPPRTYTATQSEPPLLLLPAYLAARKRAGKHTRVPPSLLAKIETMHRSHVGAHAG